MRWIALLLFLLSPPPAAARMDPGPPPWFCRPVKACNGNDLCMRVYGPPMGFNLRAVENEKNEFVLEGHHGHTRRAAVFSSLEDARFFVETGRPDSRVTVILIPTNEVGDARSFRAHGTGSRGAGARFISPENLLIACGKMPKG